MRGRRYDDGIRERAFALLAVKGNQREVARELGIAESTLRGWLRADAPPEPVAKEREDRRLAFVALAWETLENALRLANGRLERAIESGEEVNLRELSAYIGQIYDKAALASGEQTGRSEVKVTMGGELADYAR